MDQTIFNIVGAVITGGFGWFAHMIWTRLDNVSKDVGDIRVMVARDYVTDARLAEVMSEVKSDLRYIRDRLDETPQRRSSDPRP